MWRVHLSRELSRKEAPFKSVVWTELINLIIGTVYYWNCALLNCVILNCVITLLNKNYWRQTPGTLFISPWLIAQKSMYKELSHSDTTMTQEVLTTNSQISNIEEGSVTNLVPWPESCVAAWWRWWKLFKRQ